MELRDYIQVIRARQWVIVQAVVIVTLATLVVSLVVPKSYSGQAQVLITEKNSAAALLGNTLPLSTQPERTLETQVEMMKRRPIAEEVIRKLNLQTTPEELLRRVRVSALGQTNLVNITATDSDPRIAANIANAIAEVYVTSARDAERQSIAQAADEVQRRLDEAQTQIVDLGRKIVATGQSANLQSQLQIATGTYSTLAEKLEQLRINEQLETGPGRVVTSAVIDLQSATPKPVTNVLLGALVGLVLGVGLVFLFEYLDNTIKSTEEAEKLFGAPVLGTIPTDLMEKGQKRRLSIVESPGSSTAEAYRVLRNSLDFINFQDDMKTILVTSSAPGEGKSTVASNLAAALAQAGKKVVLVSVDFRRPTTDQFFHVNNQIGLSDVLLGTHSLKSALQRPGDDQLLVLAAGKMPPNPSELLGSAKMGEVIQALKEWGEWIIMDSPPLLAVADPAAAARWADGVLVVSQAGGTTREIARRAMEVLAKVGARTIGVVVWGLEDNRSASSRYGHYAGGYYYYSSYYGQPAEAGRKQGAKKKDGTPPAETGESWVIDETPGRRFATALGRVLTGVLAFLMVLVIAAGVVYLLDQYFGWGIAQIVIRAVSLR